MYYGGGSSCCQNTGYPSYGYPAFQAYPCCGHNNSSYAIILVLFILLVIVVGCRFNR